MSKKQIMKYLIIADNEAFYTQWLDIEYVSEGMIIVDLINDLISFDGFTWNQIEEDSL